MPVVVLVLSIGVAPAGSYRLAAWRRYCLLRSRPTTIPR